MPEVQMYAHHCQHQEQHYGFTDGGTIGVEMCSHSDDKPADSFTDVDTVQTPQRCGNRESARKENIRKHYSWSVERHMMIKLIILYALKIDYSRSC